MSFVILRKFTLNAAEDEAGWEVKAQYGKFLFQQRSGVLKALLTGIQITVGKRQLLAQT